MAIFEIKNDSLRDFEQSFLVAQKYLASANGYIEHTMQQSIENPNRYVLLAKWDSVEHHMDGFRNSDDFLKWRELLGPFFEKAPIVEHFTALNLK